MNLFYLDTDLRLSASYMIDKHLNKQVLECFQLLANALHPHGFELRKKNNNGIYGYTHEKHPLSRWTGMCYDNMEFVFQLALACLTEAKERFGVDYSTSYPLLDVNNALDSIPKTTKPSYVTYPCCVPSQIRERVCGSEYADIRWVPDKDKAVLCYRLYYLTQKREQISGFGWSNGLPRWFIEGCNKLDIPPIDYVIL